MGILFFIFVQIIQLYLLEYSVATESQNVTEKADPQLTAKEFLHTANLVIHDALNEIFHLLDLPSHVIENGTLQKLLKTYVGLKKINNIANKIYSDIELMTRVDRTIDNSTINFVVDINELTMETLFNHLRKKVPKHVILQEALTTTKTEKMLTTMKDEDLDWKYHEAVNVSQVEETNMTFSLDQITSNINEVWEPESELKSKVRELSFQSRRINSGDVTDIRQFPFMASVQVDLKCACGASIVSRQVVLTAASCIFAAYSIEAPKPVGVRVSSSYCDKGGQLLKVQQPYIYPLFNPETLQHNLALLKLSRPLELGSKTLKRIKVDFDTSGELMGRVVMAGFGETGRTDGGNDGDVGDPGIVEGKLAGVVTLLPPACGYHWPTVFVRLGEYRQWITLVTDDTKMLLNAQAYKGFPRNQKAHNRRRPSEVQLLSALLLKKLLRDETTKSPTTKKISFHDIFYSDFRDWYDDKMNSLDSTPAPVNNVKVEHFLANMSIVPMDYVMINSKERDQKIEANSGRPINDAYPTTTPVEYYTSIVYLDEVSNATDKEEHVTRGMLEGQEDFYDETRRKLDGNADDGQSENLDIAEINARIRAHRED